MFKDISFMWKRPKFVEMLFIIEYVADPVVLIGEQIEEGHEQIDKPLYLLIFV